MRKIVSFRLVVPTIIALVGGMVIGTVVHTAQAQTTGLRSHSPSAQMGDTMHMGPVHKASTNAWQGYYDGHLDLYLNTDVSDRSQARTMGINVSPALRNAPGTPAIYLVEGRAVAKQLAVFGSEPGESDYSPLWHEVIVRWKSGVKPVLLVRDDQIKGLAAKGKLTATTMMHTVLNCPIIHVGKGG